MNENVKTTVLYIGAPPRTIHGRDSMGTTMCVKERCENEDQDNRRDANNGSGIE